MLPLHPCGTLVTHGARSQTQEQKNLLQVDGVIMTHGVVMTHGAATPEQKINLEADGVILPVATCLLVYGARQTRQTRRCAHRRNLAAQMQWTRLQAHGVTLPVAGGAVLRVAPNLLVDGARRERLK